MTGRDWQTSTEADAAKAARAAAYPDWQDERDEPGISEPAHDHREGAICLLCVLNQQQAAFKAKLAEADQQDMFVCDGCADLYDVGCSHGFWLCAQCLDRCPDCRIEIADEAAAESLRERLRDAWGGDAG